MRHDFEFLQATDFGQSQLLVGLIFIIVSHGLEVDNFFFFKGPTTLLLQKSERETKRILFCLFESSRFVFLILSRQPQM